MFHYHVYQLFLKVFSFQFPPNDIQYLFYYYLNHYNNDKVVVEYMVLQGTGQVYFYIKRRDYYRIANVIFHVYNDRFLRTVSISQEQDNENLYIIWTNYALETNEVVGVDVIWVKENYAFNDWEHEDYSGYRPPNY